MRVVGRKKQICIFRVPRTFEPIEKFAELKVKVRDRVQHSVRAVAVFYAVGGSVRERVRFQIVKRREDGGFGRTVFKIFYDAVKKFFVAGERTVVAFFQDVFSQFGRRNDLAEFQALQNINQRL